MDNHLTLTLILSFIIASLTTWAVTPLVITFAEKFHLMDDPKKRFHPAHTHKGVIPRAGGLALFLGIILSSLVILHINTFLVSIISASTLLVVIGLMDDKHDINPYIRLLTNAIAAGIVVLCGTTVPFITNPLSGGVMIFHNPIVSMGIAFIWIMWTINIIGWSSGVDGQMPGFVSIAALTLGILSLRYSVIDTNQLPVTILCFITAGAFAGFLPWNFYPQKIMPGYGGKTLAGLFLGVLGILSYAKLGTALLVLGIPTIDAVYTLIRRFISKSSPVKPDRGHLHHRLLVLGWGRRRIALFYWGVSAILGMIALSVKSQQKLFAFLLISVVIGGFLLWVNFFSRFSKQQDPDNG